MRLSEAIRLGAMLRPKQAFHRLYDGDDSSCALMAAAEAVGMKPVPFGWDREIPDEWGWMFAPMQCPACASKPERVDVLMIHLNNDHRWTRERIADWVETVEPVKQPALEPATKTNAVDPVAEIVTG